MQLFPQDSDEEYQDEDEEWEPVEWIPYPYADFAVHLEEHSRRRFEKTDDDGGAFVRNILKLKSYFEEFYDEPHSTRNHKSFVMVLTHVSKQKEKYDCGLLAVSHDKGLALSEDLVRALHWYFTELPRAEWGSDDEATERIKAKAEAWGSK